MLKRICVLSLILVCLFYVQQVQAQSVSIDLYKNAYKKAKKSVVGIKATTVASPLEGGYALISGSGIIWSRDGLVVTNKHVAERTRNIKIILYDNRELDAKVLKMAEDVDLAVLKIDQPPLDLEQISLGNSDSLESGEIVLAIGNPGGLTHTLTQGIISALDRNPMLPDGSKSPHTYIQTDAAINPGNSGGALVNLSGELLGVPTLGTKMQSIGFAIPVNILKTVIPQLLDTTTVMGWVGVTVQDITSDLQSAAGLPVNLKGVIVTQISTQSPALGRLKQLDVITTCNGTGILTKSDFDWAVRNAKPGTKLDLFIFRPDTKKTFSLLVDVLPVNLKKAQ